MARRRKPGKNIPWKERGENSIPVLVHTTYPPRALFECTAFDRDTLADLSRQKWRAKNSTEALETAKGYFARILDVPNFGVRVVQL